MCGIAGICESEPDAKVDEELLKASTRKLLHRGPDGEGYLLRGNIGLGHRRLSIIDLEGGSQPIYNETGTVGIVFNGEIYNYQELQPELERRGHRFSSHSDTEAIVHAYEEYGASCVDHLRGMFCFAIWDGRDRSVFIARDRLGKKPLFYRHEKGRLCFASELKAILADPSIPREVDLEALDDYLAYSYVPSDTCILKGIKKLEPGNWLRWRDGELEVKQYWDVDFSAAPRLTEEEWIERMEAELRTAVRLRLRADVPLGVFLSGGIDSSGITALACQELGRPVKTFSIGFRHIDFDELQYARLVADRYQTDHQEIVVDDQDMSLVPELAYHLDEPFGDPSALPTFIICREARKQVTVVLSGDGGDEIFAGYRRYAAAVKYSRVDWIPSGIRAAAGRAATLVMPAPLWGRGLVERLSRSGSSRYLAQLSEFSTTERAALLGDHPPRAAAEEARLYEPYFQDGEMDLVSRLQLLDQKNYLPDDILVKVDRMSMKASLEARSPLLDQEVVRAANAAPVDLKFRKGAGKYLLRKVLEPHLPGEILTRRKKGFGIPIRHWFRGPIKDYASEMLLSAGARSTRFLERRPIEAIIRDHARGMRDFSQKIWALLMFEHWCREYCI